MVIPPGAIRVSGSALVQPLRATSKGLSELAAEHKLLLDR